MPVEDKNTKNLMPLTHYPTRREILDNCFNIIRGDVLKKMAPEQLRDMPEGEGETCDANGRIIAETDQSYFTGFFINFFKIFFEIFFINIYL